MTLNKLIHPLWRGVLRTLFPAACLVCRNDLRDGDRPGLCAACWNSFPRILPLFCRRCGIPLPGGGAHCRACRRNRGGPLRLIRSAARYEDSLRQCIHRFKYGGRENLAVGLGELLEETARCSPEILSCRMALPVPMHPSRRRQQGFNPAELLARELCRRSGQALETGALKRIKAGPSQTGLDRHRRRENVRGAFAVTADFRPLPGPVLLIDDVCTTGATLEACATALRQAGVRRVFALTIAREMPPASLTPEPVSRYNGASVLLPRAHP